MHRVYANQSQSSGMDLEEVVNAYQNPSGSYYQSGE